MTYDVACGKNPDVAVTVTATVVARPGPGAKTAWRPSDMGPRAGRGRLPRCELPARTAGPLSLSVPARAAGRRTQAWTPGPGPQADSEPFMLSGA